MRSVRRSDDIVDALAVCLDAASQGEASPAAQSAHGDELTELVALAQSLHVLGRVTPREAFVRTARRELVAKLPDHPAPWAARWAALWAALWRRRLPLLQVRAGAVIGALMAVAMALVLTHGVLTAAAAAAPGDFLYGLQVRVDRLPLVMTRDAEAAARLRLELADKRLSEAEEMVIAGHPDGVPAALRAYEAEMGALAEMVQRTHRQATAEREALMALWQGARADHLASLERLRQGAPVGAQPVIRHAIALWERVDAPGAGPLHETDRDPELAPSVDAPVGTPTDTPVDAPTDRPVGTPTDTPVDAPTDRPVGTPTDTPVDAPTDIPADAPVELPIDTPMGPQGPLNEQAPAEQAPPSDLPAAVPSPQAPEDAGEPEGTGDPPPQPGVPTPSPTPPQPGAPPEDAGPRDGVPPVGSPPVEAPPVEAPPVEVPPEAPPELGDQGGPVDAPGPDAPARGH
jgi:hypothetical protein